MKIASYPPMIILLDMLFVFLFILVLNEKKVISIDIPKYKLFKDAKIVYFNAKIEKYCDLRGIEYPFDSIYNLLLDECSKQKECIEAKKQFGERVYILLPKDIFDEISKISMLAFGTKSCSKLQFVINKDGVLNYTEIIKSNTCLEKISGFKKVFHE
jgi:hypothetical protein